MRLLRLSGSAALTGMGGVGKTSAMKFFAGHFASEYDHIIWLDAEGEQVGKLRMGDGKYLTKIVLHEILYVKSLIHQYSLNSILQLSRSFRELATALLVPVLVADGEATPKTLAALASDVARELAGTKCLFLLDNADDASAVADALAATAGGEGHHAVMTSRLQSLGEEVAAVEVGLFSQREAMEFLSDNIPKQKHSGQGEEIMEAHLFCTRDDTFPNVAVISFFAWPAFVVFVFVVAVVVVAAAAVVFSSVSARVPSAAKL